MFVSIPSATLTGVTGRPVSVEVHVSSGLPGFTILGSPDGACREARDRVRAALLNSGFEWPRRRVTVNLAPSGMVKSDAALDLAIGVGILAAAGQVDADLVRDQAFVGELGLDGTIGSLEAGKEADLIAIDPRLTTPLPGDEPPIASADEVLSRLIFRPHPNMVRAAWVRGRLLAGPPGVDGIG